MLDGMAISQEHLVIVFLVAVDVGDHHFECRSYLILTCIDDDLRIWLKFS